LTEANGGSEPGGAMFVPPDLLLILHSTPHLNLDCERRRSKILRHVQVLSVSKADYVIFPPRRC
jgi:hypothetical protein